VLCTNKDLLSIFMPIYNPPVLCQSRSVTIENTTRTSLSKDTFYSMLTIWFFLISYTSSNLWSKGCSWESHTALVSFNLECFLNFPWILWSWYFWRFRLVILKSVCQVHLSDVSLWIDSGYTGGSRSDAVFSLHPVSGTWLRFILLWWWSLLILD
jgi:hypothetical protein